jgi:phosphoribosylaminoimidazolecarboxamide formyltransferase / IMP cyclohydrolase
MAINRVARIDDRVPVKTVLASVSDKTGLDVLVTGLLSTISGLQILSTGGTYDALFTLLPTGFSRILRQVSDYTGQPEMQGGLVKTLDFRIYLGLLSETYNSAHRADLERTGALAIDMVVVNLYPFEKTTARPGVSFEEARGNIDIGGPCLLRAAAKNFHRVAVLVDPSDYQPVLAELAAGGGSLGLDTRFRLARKAFKVIAAYDDAIDGYLSQQSPAAMRSSYAVTGG